ncbi:hypothetical protein PCE01_04110 [Pediococcus cellicola]|nr:hypothetical protein PCE01_04110 [Pediococcus cellicola]
MLKLSLKKLAHQLQLNKHFTFEKNSLYGGFFFYLQKDVCTIFVIVIEFNVQKRTLLWKKLEIYETN